MDALAAAVAAAGTQIRDFDAKFSAIVDEITNLKADKAALEFKVARLEREHEDGAEPEAGNDGGAPEDGDEGVGSKKWVVKTALMGVRAQLNRARAINKQLAAELRAAGLHNATLQGQLDAERSAKNKLQATMDALSGLLRSQSNNLPAGGAAPATPSPQLEAEAEHPAPAPSPATTHRRRRKRQSSIDPENIVDESPRTEAEPAPAPAPSPATTHRRRRKRKSSIDPENIVDAPRHRAPTLRLREARGNAAERPTKLRRLTRS
ncbi:hypothetical protein FB451DRAFT_1554687 [Mycena latifolia]|nr:hypothetical protein FB451DRAFT_1554687 [Mycena latifolia]